MATASGNGGASARHHTRWQVFEWDVAAPQRLGLRGAWVDAHAQGVPPTAPSRPDLIIRAFVEILDVVVQADSRAGTPLASPE